MVKLGWSHGQVGSVARSSWVSCMVKLGWSHGQVGSVAWSSWVSCMVKLGQLHGQAGSVAWSSWVLCQVGSQSLQAIQMHVPCMPSLYALPVLGQSNQKLLRQPGVVCGTGQGLGGFDGGRHGVVGRDIAHGQCTCRRAGGEASLHYVCQVRPWLPMHCFNPFNPFNS